MKTFLRLIKCYSLSLVMVMNVVPSLGVASPPQLEWTRTFGSASYYSEWMGIKTFDQYVYVTGMGGPNRNLILNKYDPYGSLVWTATYDGVPISIQEHGLGLAIDVSGSVYVTGDDWWDSSTFDLLLCKFSSSGTLVWTVTLDGGDSLSGDSDTGYAVALDTVGNVYVTGNHAFNYPSFESYMLLCKYSPAGQLLWTVSDAGGGSDNIFGLDLAVSNSGNLYVAGGSYRGASYDAVLWKYTTDGVPVWKTYYDSGGYDQARGVVLDSSEGIYTGGKSSSGYFIRKYTDGGVPLWTMTLGGGAITKMAVDGEGSVYITGGKLGLDWDVLLGKVTPCGQLMWSITYDGGNNEWGYSVALDGAGDVYVAGSYGNGKGTENVRLIKYKIQDAGGCIVTAPSGLAAADECSGIAVSWNRPAAVSGYRLYRATFAGSGKTLLASLDGSASFYLDGAVTAGVTYWYAVTAVLGPTESLPSADVSVARRGCVPALAAADECAGIAVTWNTSGAVSGYRLYRATFAGSGKTLLVSLNGSASFYLDGAVTAGMTYWYAVTAVLGPTESQPSADVSVARRGCVPALAAADECSGIAISWNRPGSVSGFKLYRATFTGSSKRFLALLDGSASLYVDNGVTVGMTYWYAVTAVLGPTESQPSADVSVVRRGCVPALYTGPVRVYPNPFRRSEALRGTVKFEGIRAGGILRIYTVRGLLVWERAQTSDGVMEWDGRTGEGRSVVPGVYLWVVERARNRERGKLVVE